MKERLMIFIDGGNLFNGAKREKIGIDFKKLIDFLSKDFSLIRTYYYTGVPHKKIWDKSKETEKEFEDKLNKQRGFFDVLQFNYNFHIVTKPLILVGGERREKGIDVNIACDILWHGLSNSYDSFILISGDKDLMEVIRRMKDNGKRVMVANFKDSISNDIKRLSDNYIDLTKHKELIKR